MRRPLLLAIVVTVSAVAQAEPAAPRAPLSPDALGVITFSPSSTRLTSDAQREAEDIAAWQQKHPDSILIVEGETDRGSWDRNLRISQQRTDAVRAALVRAGADASRMVLVARGDDPDRSSREDTGRVVIRANGDLQELAREQRDPIVGEDARAAHRTMYERPGIDPTVPGSALDEARGGAPGGSAPSETSPGGG